MVDTMYIAQNSTRAFGKGPSVAFAGGGLGLCAPIGLQTLVSVHCRSHNGRKFTPAQEET